MAGLFLLKKKRFLIAILAFILIFTSSQIVSAFSSKDPFLKELWYLNAIHEPVAEQTGKETIVAVLDAGFDLKHEDLAGRYWQNNKEIAGDHKDNDNNGYEDDVNGWDFVGNDGDPSPDLSPGGSDAVISHGTLMSGIIAANTNNSIGIAGIAPKTKIMPLRILDSKGAGNTADVREAIMYAVNNGADVINISFTSLKPDVLLQQTIDWAMKQGVVIVAAIGNGSVDTNNTLVYPACIHTSDENKVIGVASVDKQGKKADFSNFGKNCVDLAAPGTDIFGAVYHDSENFLYATSYGSPWEGTSMSAPMVSAAVARLKSAYPAMTPAQIRTTLMLSADPISGTAQEREQMGAGILNLERALEIAPTLAIGSVSDRTNIKPSKSIVIGEGVGTEPWVKRMDTRGKTLATFLAYAKSFKGGVRVAMGDVNGDGVDEIITVPGKGGGPHVRIFDLSGNLLGQFFAYDSWTRNGLFLSVGDINNDGIDEILITQEDGGTGQVRVFNQKGYMLSSMYPFGRTISPVHVSVGNLDEDKEMELAATLGGKQKQTTVKIFEGSGRYIREFFVLDKFVSGLQVAVGDVDGDKQDEVIVSGDRGSKSWVGIYTREGKILSTNLVYSEKFLGGVGVNVADVDQNGRAEIYTTPLSQGGPHVRIFNKQLDPIGGFFAFDQKERFGITVGAWNP